MAHPENKPPIAQAAITMALPVRNQAVLVERAVPAWVSALSKLNRPFELLLVDDGSTDATRDRANGVASRHPEVIVLSHDSPQGYGAGIRTALAVARHPLFFYTALDYPYQTTDLRKLLDRIDEVDLVSGFRAARRLPTGYRRWRRLVDLILRVAIGLQREPLPGWLGAKQLIYNRAMRTLFGVHIDDVESAYKLFRREIFDRIPIQSNGVFVHTEIVAKATFMTLWMDEIEIGAQGGVPVDSLTIPFSLGERWKDMRRLLSDPDFGPWPPRTCDPATTFAAAPG
jgi:glycosyltransferase involved in cell wall biosynthesis